MRPEKSSSHNKKSPTNTSSTGAEELNGDKAACSCSELIWGAYKNGCNVSSLPSSALHCTSVLVTVNDHLATSIIIDFRIYSKGLKGHLRLFEDEPAPFFLHRTVMPYNYYGN